MGTSVSTKAAILAELEGPTENQPISGIGIIRGWAFSDTAGVQISQVTLSIDDKEITTIPCCSTRKDVQEAFPQFPAVNTVNSGYGITFNYGDLTSGTHSITVAIQDSSGTQFNRTHTVTVAKPGDFSFIDQASLNGAEATRDGQDIVISGLQVRDKASQQIKSVNTRLRWFQNTQALGLVTAATANSATPTKTLSNSGHIRSQIQSSSTEFANLESPLDGDTVSGIAIIRGWVIPPADHTIQRVQLFVDGEPFDMIPCCSHRGDVAAAFPDNPNAGNSGFGLTFNYGDLNSGVYTLTVETEDSAGVLRRFTRGVIVRQPGEYVFLDKLDFTNATVRITGEQLVVDNAVAQDKSTGQTAVRSLRYQWDVPAQTFMLMEESIDEVTVTSMACTVDGDTSSLDALRNNPGADGISLPETIIALNELLGGGRVMVDFRAPGVIHCNSDLPVIQRSLVLSGDIDGDGVADIMLDGNGDATGSAQTQASAAVGLEVRGSDVTLRSLSLRHFTDTALRIQAQDKPVTNVAVLDMDAALSEGVQGIQVTAQAQVTTQAESGQVIGLHQLLLNNNRLEGGNGVAVFPQGEISENAEPVISNVNISGNTIKNPVNGVTILGNIPNATLSGINVVNNSVDTANADSFLIRSTSKNVIEAVVSDNKFTDSGLEGVMINSGAGDQADNTLMVDIRDNIVSTATQKDGIVLIGGKDNATGNILKATITGNVATNVGTGVYVLGGTGNAMENIITADIYGNQLMESAVGISLEGGVGAETGLSSRDNLVDIHMADNTITDMAGAGVLLSGGFDGAVNNQVKIDASDNNIQGITAGSGFNIIGGWTAGANIVEGLIARNQIKDTVRGIFICAGTTLNRESSQGNIAQGESTKNKTLVEILGNRVQGSEVAGIVVVGGIGAINGAVTENTAQSAITNNVSDGIICEDNIEGNSADCVIEGNTEMGLLYSAHADHDQIHQLASRQNQLSAKAQQLRNRAAFLKDQQLQKKLLQLAEQLEALLDD